MNSRRIMNYAVSLLACAIIATESSLPQEQKSSSKEPTATENIKTTDFDKNTYYFLTPREKQSYDLMHCVYSGQGMIYFLDVDGRKKILANHGFYVAKPKEPSLERLVKMLSGNANGVEAKAQRLLDFVTEKIQFEKDSSELDVSKNVYKVLQTKKSDCSGKAILYASMLEQIGADYYLAYEKEHIAVVVQGEFPDNNKTSFLFNKKRYFFAETTCKGYRIGITELEEPSFFKDIEQLQKPGPITNIYDLRRKINIADPAVRIKLKEK